MCCDCDRKRCHCLLVFVYRDEEQWVCPCHLPTGGTERDGLHSRIMDSHQGGETDTFINYMYMYIYML